MIEWRHLDSVFDLCFVDYRGSSIGVCEGIVGYVR